MPMFYSFDQESSVRTTTNKALLCVGLMLAASLAGADSSPASGTHKIQVSSSVAAELKAQGATPLAEYESFAIFQVGEQTAPYIGAPGVEVRDHFNSIFLNTGRLDTSNPEVQALRKSVGSFSGKRLHLVQFVGPVQAAWRDQLLASGVRIVNYVPANAYLIYGTQDQIAAVQASSAKATHVQWEAAYLPEYKIHPGANMANALATNLPTQFIIQMFADPEANPATLKLIDQLKLQPVSKQNSFLTYLNVTVSLPVEALPTIAAQPDVISIQPYFVPVKLCERQDQILAGNIANNKPSGAGYLAWLQSKGFTQQQFVNSGFAVDLTDSGVDNGTIRPNHPNLFTSGSTSLNSRVIYNRVEGTPNPGSSLAGCDGHGNINAHIIGGYDDQSAFPHVDSLGFHYGLGVCPFVRIGSSVIFDPDFFTAPNYTTLQSDAYKDGSRLSSNSWGNQNPRVAGTYTVDSQEYDMLVRDAQPEFSPNPNAGNQEMVILFAAGNSGPGSITVSPPGTAKNLITVGAAENVQAFGGPDASGISDSGADNANDIIFFSSRGPCADGRHKPDIMSPGTHVSGGVAQADNPAPTGTALDCFLFDASGVSGGPVSSAWWPFFPDGQELFTACSGTSQATPGAAGSAALIRQWFINKYGQPASAAMTKAYLMNTARYMTGVGAGDTLWSDNQGMGEINLGMAFDDSRRIVRDQVAADLFTASGQMRVYGCVVNDSTRPVRVTVAWTDAPGFTGGAAYANNLDLIVTIGGKTYRGNVFDGANSSTGGQADFADNVESVFLPAGVSGPFTVSVVATDINSDGVPNNATPVDQDFALVVYNAGPAHPVIQSFPVTNLFVAAGQPATFTVQAINGDPSAGALSYQWRRNGADILGATNTFYTIASAQLTDIATYSVTITDTSGSTTSPDGNLTVVPTVPLNFAVDYSNFTWTAAATNGWFGQTNLSHDGVASAQSYFIQPGDHSALRTTITGPGTLTFWWRIVSPTNAATLAFSDFGADYTNSIQITGPTSWSNQSVFIGPGSRTVEWNYQNISSQMNRTNGAYLDQLNFVPGATLPFIVTQPASQGVSGGNTVVFRVVAGGTPQLIYQWYVNDSPITGATNSSYTITLAGAVDNGAYTVRISNAFGQVLSQPALLQVVPLFMLGANDYGQATQSVAATNAVGMAAGAWHTLIVKSDGTVLAWGANGAGQCTVPATLRNAMAVAGGGSHSLALRVDGTVIAWGDNSYGQATPPTGLANVTAIAAGDWHSAALRADGTVVVWGDNSQGQLNIPSGLRNVIAISAGGSHTLALKADGTVVGWGANVDPQGNFAGQSIVPWDAGNADAIAAGEFHSLAARLDGSTIGWGYNVMGETQAPGSLSNVVAVSAGNQFSVAVKADRTAMAWGNDWNGQCDLPPSMSNVVAVATGDSHTVVFLGRPTGLPQMVRTQRQGTQFGIWVQTVAGFNYALESSSTLTAGSWSSIQTIRGNGSRELLLDTAANAPWRFYRIRQW